MLPCGARARFSTVLSTRRLITNGYIADMSILILLLTNITTCSTVFGKELLQKERMDNTKLTVVLYEIIDISMLHGVRTDY